MGVLMFKDYDTDVNSLDFRVERKNVSVRLLACAAEASADSLSSEIPHVPVFRADVSICALQVQTMKRTELTILSRHLHRR